MKQRFYFDTSVFGGLFDKEFKLESKLLFTKVELGLVTCVYSDLTEKELTGSPQIVKDYFNNLKNKERVIVSDDAFTLAKEYLAEKVVGETSFDDCLHIAAATLNKVDILVSWNFKHIVNVYRIRGYNSVNLKFGYQTLNIHSPKEIVGYERN